MLNSKSDVFQKELRPPAHTIHIHSHMFPPMTGWWSGRFFYVPIYLLGMSSSQLTCIFFRGVGQPPTRTVSPLFPLAKKIKCFKEVIPALRPEATPAFPGRGSICCVDPGQQREGDARFGCRNGCQEWTSVRHQCLCLGLNFLQVIVLELVSMCEALTCPVTSSHNVFLNRNHWEYFVGTIGCRNTLCLCGWWFRTVVKLSTLSF